MRLRIHSREVLSIRTRNIASYSKPCASAGFYLFKAHTETSPLSPSYGRKRHGQLTLEWPAARGKRQQVPESEVLTVSLTPKWLQPASIASPRVAFGGRPACLARASAYSVGAKLSTDWKSTRTRPSTKGSH
jgi:hypothetical protein